MVRVLIIDNYDSFTYNLVQQLGEFGAELTVVRNDATSVAELDAVDPDRIVISPGPCTPNEAGISVETIQHFAGRVPMLGVCLGHQCIVAAFGGDIVAAPKIVHGKTSEIFHRREGVLAGLEIPFDATRYHSLIADRATLPPELKVTAETNDEIVMGVRHRTMSIEGVQFHPESILTGAGRQILATFIG